MQVDNENIKARKLERLFDRYSFNLNSCCPDLADTFVCPLCLNHFSRSEINSEVLSEEHIIPESLKGKDITLTCKKCNNTTGSELDAHLVKRVKSEEAFREKGGPVRGKFSIGEGSQNVEIFIRENIELVGLPNQSDPKLVAKLIEELKKEGTLSMTMNWSLQYNEVRSKTAILRSAYLMMFHYFGYSYILRGNIPARIRQQVKQPIVSEEIQDEELLNGIITIPNDIERSVVAVVTSPPELRSFIVMLKMSDKLNLTQAVILPGDNATISKVYSQLSSEQRKANCDFKIIPFDDQVFTQREHKDYYHFIWERVY